MAMLSIMPRSFDCPYLGRPVELTDEREAHIRSRHPEVLREGDDLLAEAIRRPQSLCRSHQDEEVLIFVRWYDDLLKGRYLKVPVKIRRGARERCWVITAYLSGWPAKGEVVWSEN
jgi:hypothetical protein